MKKSELKTGMLFQYNDGTVGMIINEELVEFDDNNGLKHYDEDLVNKDCPEYTIDRLSKVLDCGNLRAKNWNGETLSKNLLWERNSNNKYLIDGVEYSESTLRSLIKKATS